MNDAAETPLNELVDRALAKMATGEWRMVLTHPNPAEGSSSCGTDVPREIARRALAAAPLPEEVVAFLTEAARYFEGRPTGGEDRAHWSNVTNAENCKRAAALITQQAQALADANARIKAMSEALAFATNLIMEHEPGDSRAVSAEAVALASIATGNDNPECWEIIRRARGGNND